MYDEILVPLDGSELAEVALPYAEELSGRLGSNVTLIHVAGPLHYAPDRLYNTYLAHMAQITRQLAERYVAEPERKKGIKVEAKMLAGEPAEEIIDYSEKIDAGLIIMATHGQSGIKRWPMGSVAERVMRVSKQPVWLIRARDARSDMREKGALDRALVPLDGSKESEAVIPYIEELASRLEADVILLQVLPLGHHGINPAGEGYEYIYYRQDKIESDKAFAKDYLDGVSVRLKQKGVKVESQVRFGSAAEEIIELSTTMQADVVAMSTHGRSGIARWVIGSVAERVLYEGCCPLLLVRPPVTKETIQHQENSKGLTTSHI
ncbi:MAG: universal stress protein [Dehalococcoidales bacterium]|nr:universal stress protein [Dehalococcoidales bacterium]